MKNNLTLIMITKDAEELIERTLKSVEGLVDEIIAVDNNSTDNTLSVLKKHGALTLVSLEKDLGKLRKMAFEGVKTEWVLMLDSDEVLTHELKEEIKNILKNPPHIEGKSVTGFRIPYKNHFMGKPLHHGGEDYKIMRLFKKDSVHIQEAMVHEKFEVHTGSVAELEHHIHHHSYRSIRQIYRKFTDYGIRDAKQRKWRGEKFSLAKVITYPPHMFFARYVEDKGYKDGIRRIPLDLGFAYMEFLGYALIPFVKSKKQKE